MITFRTLHRVKRSAWALLLLVAIFSVVSVVARMSDALPSYAFLYIIQPVGALMLAGLAWYMVRGSKDRAHRRSEKAFMVGSVLSVWFVIYFLSGLTVTYVKNTLITTPLGITSNILAYGSAAVALEYVRHSLMQLAGRRNILWFGALVVAVFALQQLNFTAFNSGYTGEQLLKFFVSDIVPIAVASMLLTYLAVSAGLPSMLVYKLGVLAVTLLLPILPKHDWYLIGVSSLLLSLAVYLIIDRAQQGRKPEHRRHHHHISKASNATFIIVMIALILFVTGIFNYKPVVIVSNSMQPVYSRGAVIVVRTGAQPMDIEKGNIIQYKHKQTGDMITHRVVDIQQAANGSGDRVFITKGDNNQSEDIPVPQSQLRGVVEAQVPYVGYPTIWLRSLIR